MQTYARVVSSVVMELIIVPNGRDINAMFTPDLVLTMVLVTPSTGTPVQGSTWDGSVFSNAVIPPPSPDELLAQKISAGIQISSAQDDLAGTYAIDDASLQQITGLVALIGAGVALPQTPLPYPDIQGTPHSFSADEIKLLAGAMGTYVFQLRQTWGALLQNIPAPWPDQPVTL